METILYTKEMKEDLLKTFLIVTKRLKKYLKCEARIYWVYKIYNTKNDKIYIGKTIDLRRRAMDYINEYCHGYKDRKINEAMINLGIENFIMYPLEVAYTSESASIKEKYYIDLYDSIKKGYNTSMGSPSNDVNHKKHTPVKQTIYAKVAKSKVICAYNPETNQAYFSTGLKLFGDFIGRHKDEIKSAARRQTKIDGYFIFYLNKKDFSSQIQNVNSKIEKNINYNDYNLQYPLFLYSSKNILSIIQENKNENNIEIFFITQSNDECGYKYDSFDVFLKYYKNIPNNLINFSL